MRCPACDGNEFVLARNGAIVCAACGVPFTADGKPTQWHLAVARVANTPVGGKESDESGN